jgi:hypothetical protein
MLRELRLYPAQGRRSSILMAARKVSYGVEKKQQSAVELDSVVNQLPKKQV